MEAHLTQDAGVKVRREISQELHRLGFNVRIDAEHNGFVIEIERDDKRVLVSHPRDTAEAIRVLSSFKQGFLAVNIR